MPEDKGSERFIKLWSRRISLVSMVGLGVMLIVSLIDIIGSKFFLWPFPGGMDIVSLIAVIVIAFAIATTELIGGHVRLDLGLGLLPKSIKALCQKIGHVLSIIIFLLLMYASMIYGVSLLKSGEGSMTVGIPFYPFVFVITFACVPVVLVLLIELIKPEKVEKEKELDKI